jgi:hypothetical protein
MTGPVEDKTEIPEKPPTVFSLLHAIVDKLAVHDGDAVSLHNRINEVDPDTEAKED